MTYVSELKAFAETAETRTYDLHPLVGGCEFFVVSHYYYFENAGGDAGFMPTGLLEESFCELLREYPLMAGTMRTRRRGPPQITVDRDNLNLPDFRETQCDVEFSQAKAAKFAPSVLPGGLIVANRYSAHSNRRPEKLARAHVVRFKGGSGVLVYFGISHTLADGHAYVMVVRRWAELCAHLARTGSLADKPGTPLCFDAAAVEARMPAPTPPPGAVVSRTFMKGGLVTWLLSWLSLRTQSRIMRRMCGDMALDSHFYFISRDTVDEMHKSIRAVLPEDQRVSSNDVLSALYCAVVAQCVGRNAPAAAAAAGDGGAASAAKDNKSKDAPSASKKPELLEYVLPVDVRPRIKALSEYGFCGSAVLIYRVVVPLAELQGEVTPERLAVAATAVRRGTESVDVGYIQAYVKALATEPGAGLRPFVYPAGSAATLVATNHSRMGHYKVDFGWGAPTWANPVEDSMAPLAYMYPAPPGRDGHVLHLMTTKDLQDRMQQVPFWRDNVEFIR